MFRTIPGQCPACQNLELSTLELSTLQIEVHYWSALPISITLCMAPKESPSRFISKNLGPRCSSPCSRRGDRSHSNLSITWPALIMVNQDVKQRRCAECMAPIWRQINLSIRASTLWASKFEVQCLTQWARSTRILESGTLTRFESYFK